MTGKGKYGDISEAVIKLVDADIVIVQIMGGIRGNGFAMSTKEGVIDQTAQLPKLLRAMADMMESSGEHLSDIEEHKRNRKGTEA